MKVSEALNRLLKVLIIAINTQSHSEHSYYEQGRGSLSAFSHMDTSDPHPQTTGGWGVYTVTLRVYRNN